MGKINQKITTMNEALLSLADSIKLFEEYENINQKDPSIKNEKIFLAMRDSVIQRFEYCTDLFWKVLKLYLEEVEKIDLPTYSPRGVIRETVKVKTITEEEAKASMNMIVSRNKTSHIYHQETAELIAEEIPGFFDTMTTIVKKIDSKVTESNK